MAKSNFEAETKMLLRSIKQGHVQIDEARILIEDLNAQILVAIEARAALEESRLDRKSEP
ncbi:MAG: hypothetical protein WDN00_17475 [Limisphaerales bacterium]